MDLTWREAGRGLWECEAPDGHIPGGVHEIRRGQWSGWLNNGVRTRDYRSRVAAQAAVEQLLEVGAYPTPRPEPQRAKKTWRRVENSPDPAPGRPPH